MPFDNDYYYVVDFQDMGLPEGVRVELALFRGNEAADEGALNPTFYQRLPPEP